MKLIYKVIMKLLFTTIMVLTALLVVTPLRLVYFKTVTKLHREGLLSNDFVTFFVFGFLFKRAQNKHYKSLCECYIQALVPEQNTKRFHEDPRKILEGLCIVVKSANHSSGEKGVLLVKYSHFFPLLLKLYDCKVLALHYDVVLEPSWAGYFDLSILSYINYPSSVYVMAYEKRDFDLLTQLKSNLVPVNVGPNWYVDPSIFKFRSVESKYDLVVVSAWAKFKRHKELFVRLGQSDVITSVALVGYPVDMKLSQIKEMATRYCKNVRFSFFENVDQVQVADIISRSKVSLLWSKFEGNNRSLIESIYCGTPIMLYRGHNYGESYSYIQEQTGRFADERDIFDRYLECINLNRQNVAKVAHRERNIDLATIKLNTVMRTQADLAGREWKKDIVAKANSLHGMKYLNPNECDAEFEHDYEFIKKNILSK